jgi:hypothetical protein
MNLHLKFSNGLWEVHYGKNESRWKLPITAGKTPSEAWSKYLKYKHRVE